MPIRDRIRELRRVRADQLLPNPFNWRLHPAPQRAALREILADVGYSAALLARELPDGGLELIDGHLRAETTPDDLVPVLVLDVDAAESLRILATLDPLAGAAKADAVKLEKLLAEAKLESPALRDLVTPSRAADPPEAAPPELFQLLIDCPTEEAQQELFERLSAEGWKIRALVL